jgi:hypothetical protein
MLDQLYECWAREFGGDEITTRYLINHASKPLLQMLLRVAPDFNPDTRHIPNDRRIGRFLKKQLGISLSGWRLTGRRRDGHWLWRLVNADAVGASYHFKQSFTPPNMQEASYIAAGLVALRDKLSAAVCSGTKYDIKMAKEALAEAEEAAKEYMRSFEVSRTIEAVMHAARSYRGSPSHKT